MIFRDRGTGSKADDSQIVVERLDTGERRLLNQTGVSPHFVSTGHLIFARAGTILAMPFDIKRLEATGGPVTLVDDVAASPTGVSQFDVSENGTLVYVAGRAQGSGTATMVWVNRNGEEQPLPAPPHNYQFPRISPDGRRVAVGIPENDEQVWIYDVVRNTLTRLTLDGDRNSVPAWAPDGTRIALRSIRSGKQNLFWQPADGSAGLEELLAVDRQQIFTPSAFSPDGKLLAFIDNNTETARDIWILTLSDRKAQPFLKTRYNETTPKFSPDGKWIAYSSDESGRREIYVQPYPGPGGKTQISTEGGGEPVWNPRGGELFYRNGTKMMAVDVNTNPCFSAGKPKVLFDGPYQTTTQNSAYYDVSPDGQRFLMLKAGERQTDAMQLHVVLNWFEELKQRVPVP